MKLEFSRQIFEKKIQISNFMKFQPVGAELCRADGQTDIQIWRAMLISAFRNFANGPEDTKKLLCAVTCIPRSSEQE